MKTRHSRTAQRLLILLTFSLIFALPACKNDRNLSVSEDFKAYIYAYTSGIVSRAAPIRLRFTEALIEETEIGNEVEAGILSFEPSISGRAIWEDERTIRFVAEEDLPSGKTYFAKVEIAKLYDNVPKDLRTFMFDFQIKEQFFEVNIEGLRSESDTDLSRQKLVGTVVTADIAESEAVQQVLSVTQKGNKDLAISWQHDDDMLHHHFIIENVERQNTASEIELKWQGKPLGVKNSGSETVEVPAIGDFKINDVEVIQQDGEQFVLVEFSDPISKMQDIEGLVSLVGVSDSMNFIIDRNTVRAYPTSRMTGEQTVNVSRGILNVQDKPLAKPSDWNVSFVELSPQIKLANNGVILPSSDKGLIFPFDAVSLNAVDVEIFKIYEGNVLQFLQTNDFNGDYDLERVGRVILQKRIALQRINPSAKLNDWTRYALDLNDLIQQEPNALYQVRLSFKQSYSTYACGETAENADSDLTVLESENNLDDNGEYRSYWDYSYGDYDWEQRDNPCNASYYTSYYRLERFARSNIIASDLGIVAKKGTDGSYFVVVNDLISAKPISGTAVKFYDYQQQLISELKTDGDGVAQGKIGRKPFFVVAEKSGQRGYLKMQDGYSLSVSRYDVGGAKEYKGIKGYLYGERGVWRPGDSLHLNFVLEDKLSNLPPVHPVTFELYDPRGQLQQVITKTENVNQIYSFATATDENAPTGVWRAKVKVGGAEFDRSLRIETVKPNRLKIKLDFGKNRLTANDELAGKLQVNWLHGAAARNIRTEVKVQLEPTKTTFKNYNNYIFDDPARAFSSTPQIIFNQNTNENGGGIVTTKISTNDAAAGRMKANFSVRAYEKSGEFSSDNFSMTYEPYSDYVGVALPTQKSGEKRLDMNKNYSVKTVSLSANGQARANKKLSIGLYRVEWRWWWDSGSDNITNYSSSSHYGAVQRGELVTNAKGEAAWNVKVAEWGRYLVRVCDDETGHCTGDVFYSGYPWNDGGMDKQAAAMLTFSSDKTKYNVGDKVSLKVPLSESGRALITIENGTKVIQKFWQTAEAGDNEFTFTATEEMSPNVYAHVTLVQPHAQVLNDLPIRLYGVLPIMVENPKTRLSPQIAMKSELQPNETFTVTVSEKNRQPMAYTLAIVDEGLLDLTRFKTPNPWEHFYAKEALGVQTWDMYDYVIGASTGKIERILSIGGDDAIGPREGQKANRFKPVVRFVGPFYLKSGSKAHKITMPNYVGSVRVMVVAADKGAYGNAQKTVPVRKPLMVLGTLPRVLSPNESVRLPITVFAMDKKVKNVTVKITTNGLLKTTGAAQQSLTFQQTGDEVLPFDLVVADKTGVARVKITATSGGETATQDIELEVRNPNPYLTDVFAQTIEKGKNWTQTLQPIGMNGTNTATLEVSNMPAINLEQRLNYLVQYPHGCVEQVTSAGFPQLFVQNMIKTDKATALKLDDNIRATITAIKQFQTTNGGFGYWQGDGETSAWGTTYAGHFLLEAKEKGFNLPPTLLENWKKYQTRTAKTWNGGAGYDNSDLDQAYRLYTLALADAPEWGAMNRLKEQDNLSTAARWRLAAAYAIAGKKTIANSLVKSLKTTVKTYRELGGTYGSDVRDQAMILETLTLLGDRNKAAIVLKSIAARLNGDEWHSTQTTAYALLAIGKFTGATKNNNKVDFEYQINGTTKKISSESPLVQIALEADNASKVTIKNKSGGVLFARLINSGQPTSGNETDGSSNLAIVLQYKDLNGNALNPATLRQGEDFIAEVSITNPGLLGNYKEMALTQIFPAGWEIHNARLNNMTAYSNSSAPEYQDIRDDRVYTYFDLNSNQTVTYRLQLNAAYQGRFYLPAVSTEAMYDSNINAREAGMWVTVE